ncbi:MAG: MMPL family transporter [Treponema sp.]|jgi:predicted RND superfamily exporter protein|nr:MMPL family transporter [Treponema sp.]
MYDHPRLIIALIALITVFFAIQLPRAEIDNNNVSFLPAKDPARLMSDYIDDTFGGSLSIMVGLERPYGTVFDPAFLNTLKNFVTKVKEIPLVDEVNSIITANYITGDNEGILVEPLVGEDFSGTQAEIAELKRRVASWDAYRNVLVSSDLSATQVTISFPLSQMAASHPEVNAALKEVRSLSMCFDGEAAVYFTGQPVISDITRKAMGEDMLFLIPLVILVVLAALILSFRRLDAVLLPLITVIVAVIWMVGAMPLFGVKLTIVSVLLPVILIAVGSAYGIHIVTHYITDTANRTLTVGEHRALIVDLMGKITKPVFLAALTTFAGFVSFCFTSVAPIWEFGAYASLGVIEAFVLAVTLIPSLLLVRGPYRERQSKKGKSAEDPISTVIGGAFTAVAQKKGLVLIAAALVVALSLVGLSRVINDNVMVEYFKPKSDIVRSDRFILEKFAGSTMIDVIFDAERTEDLLAPEVLSAVDRLNTYLMERFPLVGKASGFTDMVKRINQVFNADESPEGLAPAAGDPGGEAELGFGGFGDDDFGFGDFGFDEYPGDANEAAFPDKNAAPADFARRLQNYSAADLFVMLDTAAGQAPAMNATDLVRELGRQVNYQGLAYYEIPVLPPRYGKTSSGELQGLISNYLVLLAGSLDRFANDPLEPTVIRTAVMLRTQSHKEIQEVAGRIDAFVAGNFPDSIRVRTGGGAMVQGSLNRYIVRAQLTSVGISIFMVFLIVAFANRSLTAGLIGSLPLLISILVNFAVMGFTGIKLNLGTSLIASLTVGIGVDYTIHYLDCYIREFRLSGGQGDFLRGTFTSSGKAILINAVSVGAGFVVLAFSSLNVLRDLGLLIALTMGVSALVSLTVIPALLAVIKPKFILSSKDTVTTQGA